MKTRLIFCIIMFISGISNAFADKTSDLRAGEWVIESIECKSEAADPARQAFVDSCTAFINHPSFSDKESFSYVFTETELLITRKGKTDRYAYKASADKVIVDLGGGKVYILGYKFVNGNLVLSLGKDLFFSSEYAPKNEELKSAVKSLFVIFNFSKK